ncbi:hypothetical protein ACFC58_42360, partial [Kitasatospora purpeofusca]|uniref:hypothetical protein n=1 Tax=Kitasatospora purpeofusca TaxID=67352 RepID=UPI0035DF07C5
MSMARVTMTAAWVARIRRWTAPRSGGTGRSAAARRPTAHRIIEVRIRPLPATGPAGPAPGSDFTPEDIAFLRSHAPADLRGIGPCRPLP